MKDASKTYVVLATNMGTIEIAVYSNKAPASVRAFLTLVESGAFTQFGAFYRTVRKHGNDRGCPPIDVIQGGLVNWPDSLRGVEHETTRQTGLRHLDGAVSLARGAVGSATGAAFFICIGDQPALDAGGGRDPFADGQGFAVFGQVTRGMEVVNVIHQLPTSDVASDPYLRGQMLDPPARILRASCTVERPIVTADLRPANDR